MPYLEYTPPRDIDGEPAEVAERVREQLAAIAPELEELAEQSAIQLRSAFLTALLERQPDLQGDELGAVYARSPQAARCKALLKSARLFARICEGV